jgi:branched-subunit amino acid transport protein
VGKIKRALCYIPVAAGLYLGLVLSDLLGEPSRNSILYRFGYQLSAVVTIMICDLFFMESTQPDGNERRARWKR